MTERDINMIIAIACDHAGFPIKKIVMDTVVLSGHKVIDLGTDSEGAVDYPDISCKLALTVQCGEAERGILICGSGIGACIVANKVKGVYAGICHDTYSARQGVEHDDMNVLCIGGRVVGPELASEIVAGFVTAYYVGGEPGQERHARRVAKIRALESENMK
jgi:ribose 5-phosphate isomerase B